jgi:hypothetical protein
VKKMQTGTDQHHCFLGTVDTVDGRSSVQRVAPETHLPKQIEEGWGEPKSNELANARENEPKRVVDFGGRSPAAEHSAATLLGLHREVKSAEGRGRPFRTSVAVAAPSNKAANGRIVTQPSRRVAALCAAAPKEALADCWRSEATKGKHIYGHKASSLVNQAKSTTVDRPKAGLVVRKCARRTRVFSEFEVAADFDFNSDTKRHECVLEMSIE